MKQCKLLSLNLCGDNSDFAVDGKEYSTHPKNQKIIEFYLAKGFEVKAMTYNANNGLTIVYLEANV